MKQVSSFHAVYRFRQKASIRAMFAFSTSGLMCPPMVVYPYQIIPSEITKRVPYYWGLGYNPTGWATAEVFYECTGHVFAPHLGEHHVKFHVVLFRWTPHASDISTEWTLLWAEHDPYLWLLKYFNTRDWMLQLLDNRKWVGPEVVLQGHWQNSDEILHEEGLILSWMERAVQKCATESSAAQSFRAWGFYPWNPVNIYFPKCLGGKKTNQKCAMHNL